MNKTSLLYWWPLVKDIDVPMPETHIVMEAAFGAWCSILDNRGIDSDDENKLKTTAESIGYPLFIRTDLYSGKHRYMDSCYVADESQLIPHIIGLIDSSFAYDIGLSAIVFREFLSLEYTFKAFHGLPIAKERRYFAEEGEVFIHHPYWPEDAIKFNRKWTEPTGWKRSLVELNTETPDEVELLTEYAEQISLNLDGQWSIDFAKGADGQWYFIDAAEAMKSWIHPDYAKPEGWGKK